MWLNNSSILEQHRLGVALAKMICMYVATTTTQCSPHRHGRHTGLQVVPQPQRTLPEQGVKASRRVRGQVNCSKALDELTTLRTLPQRLAPQHRTIRSHTLWCSNMVWYYVAPCTPQRTAGSSALHSASNAGHGHCDCARSSCNAQCRAICW